jgi:hypothetical protein
MSESEKALSRGVSFTCHEPGLDHARGEDRYIWSVARTSWSGVYTLK